MSSFVVFIFLESFQLIYLLLQLLLIFFLIHHNSRCHLWPQTLSIPKTFWSLSTVICPIFLIKTWILIRSCVWSSSFVARCHLIKIAKLLFVNQLTESKRRCFCMLLHPIKRFISVLNFWVCFIQILLLEFNNTSWP